MGTDFGGVRTERIHAFGVVQGLCGIEVSLQRCLGVHDDGASTGKQYRKIRA